jgi:peptidoglycan/xylan/chitin deacetylase (PgdA/CDA1 family)
MLDGLNRFADGWWLPKGGLFPLIPRRKQAGCFQVLTYHRVNPNGSRFEIDTVPPDVFESHARCLAEHFSVLTIEEIVARLRDNQPLPPRCAAITFDDGYADNFTFAHPILKAYGLQATFYLTTGSIGSGKVLWFDRVLRAFEHTTKDAALLPFQSEPVSIRSTDERYEAGFRALSYLRTLPAGQLERAMDDLFAELRADAPAVDRNLMLTWDQVADMSRYGHRFGSHTVTHPILSRLPLPDVESEIMKSKRMIEEKTGRSVTTFAYPSGRTQDYSADVVMMLKRAGYAAAVTNTTFAVNSRHEDLFRLNRMRPWERNPSSFFFKLCWYKLLDSGTRSPGSLDRPSGCVPTLSC